jgi:phosphopantothenoylcysteine decarboxylase/phosphopantothenate--cysteine ligase
VNLLVTAGPTREAIDPVRFISNRSSGKMGHAVAAAAARRGHGVRLVSGPVALHAPPGVTVKRVESAEEMLEAVRGSLGWCQALVMAAAVADWRPRRVSPRKIKKGGGPPAIELEPTEDILLALRPIKGERLFVGFAAETHDLLAEGRRKLHDKGLDLVVANDVTEHDAGFEVDTNRVTLLAPGADPEPWGLLTKDEIGERLVEWIEARAVSPKTGT